MSLNSTPSANRVHIGFFGNRNAGKSSLVNRLTNQEVSVVSDVLGTTTDPVQKSMEILPLGPVVIIDTPGFDDDGSLGEKRVQRTKQILNKSDIAVLVIDGTIGLAKEDRELLEIFKDKKIEYVVAVNKADLMDDPDSAAAHYKDLFPVSGEDDAERCAGYVMVSSEDGTGIEELKECLSKMNNASFQDKTIVRHMLSPKDLVILVCPIDESAPKGRMILPQQQMMRDVLDADAVNIVVKETELAEALEYINIKPRMVITDSQAFKEVSQIVPEDIVLTSFSILLANYKGFLDTAVRGAAALSDLKDGDTVLVAEGCTHHRQCNDIGTVKLPKLIKKYSGADIRYEASSGQSFPEDLSKYALVLHCGGCMVNEREVLYRMNCAIDQGVPFTNYGIAIAQMNGILKRTLSLFPELQKLVD